MAYKPLAITYQQTGLVKDRAAYVLPEDAYQDLNNIYLYRGRLKRREGYTLLGRLRRNISDQTLANADGTNDFNIGDILSTAHATETNAQLATQSIVIKVAPGTGNETQFTSDGVNKFARTSGTTYNIYAAQSIISISQAASAVIDFGAAHTFAVGNKLIIQSVVGMTEINDQIGTVTAIGATTVTVNINTMAYTAYSSGGTAYGSWVNLNTGEINLVWASGSTPPGGTTITVDYGYYPMLPVMGLPSREIVDINAEQTVAFDTKYAYRFNNTSNQFEEISSATAVTWTGSNTDFFYGTTYWRDSADNQYFWVTNFKDGDPIRLYNGTDWYIFAPSTSPTDEMSQAKIFIPYKGRMVALNTYEGPQASAVRTQYPQRARWSQIGAPVGTTVLAGPPPEIQTIEEWRSDIRGRGGFVDAPTNEHIVSAQFVRDLLVVGFEHSTWALRYTGNEILPFAWERINKELGSESTFSMIPFDRGVLYVGDKSINICDGNGVERIDDNIPDEVFNIHNTYDTSLELGDGAKRVHGIRDFFERVVYWTFPDAESDLQYPSKVLVFNYQNKSWALFNDSFTCFGQYQRFNDITWADLEGITWQEANFSWVTAKLQSQFPNIIAGNQQGHVLIMNQQVANSRSLSITAISGGASNAVITVPNHNLQSTVLNDEEPTEYVKITGCIGTGSLELNDRVYQINVINENTFTLYEKPRYAITAITQSSNAVITAPGHTFTAGQHFYIDRVTAGMTQINNLNGVVKGVSGNDITIDINTSGFIAYTAGGYIQNLDANVKGVKIQDRDYLGGGKITRVMGFEARSKKFNMFQDGRKNFLGYIDFLADVTDAGEFSCDLFTDYNDTTPINESDDQFFNRNVSTQREQFGQVGKKKDIHRLYCPVDAQFFEYRLTLDERQMFTEAITDSDVSIDGIIVWSERGSTIVDT